MFHIIINKKTMQM